MHRRIGLQCTVVVGPVQLRLLQPRAEASWSGPHFRGNRL